MTINSDERTSDQAKQLGLISHPVEAFSKCDIFVLSSLFWCCYIERVPGAVQMAVFSAVTIESISSESPWRESLRGQAQSIPTPLLFVFLSFDCLSEHRLTNSGYLCW